MGCSKAVVLILNVLFSKALNSLDTNSKKTAVPNSFTKNFNLAFALFVRSPKRSKILKTLSIVGIKISSSKNS